MSTKAPNNRYLRQRQVLDAVPFSASTLWRKVKAGEFPSPVKLSTRVTAWSEDAVLAWLEAR